MRVRVGTSGFSYDFWRGSFYPPGLQAARMLSFYASQLETVEINSSFYGLPSPKTVAHWAEQVPQAFRFALKAPRSITHQAKLRGASELVERFVGNSAKLGGTRGPLLFQLPPSARVDLPALRDLLDLLPEGLRVALEPRHASWITDPVLTTLSDHGQSLCLVDTDAAPASVLATADWGYVRLRRESYDDAALAHWAERLLAGAWRELFVYFKHADEAPSMALRFRRACGESRLSRRAPGLPGR